MVPKDENNNSVFQMSPLLAALPPPPPAVGSVPPPAAAPAPMSRVLDEQYQAQVRLLQLIVQSGYDMIQCNGQRRTGPPRDWVGPPPGPGCEVFIGKIPRDLYEDELFPKLMEYGRLYELRMMMDFSGTNRGFGFAQYSTPEEARRAVMNLDGFPIRPGKFLGVVKSLDNRRLFVGGLPKDKTKEDILEELSKLVKDIVQVILYSSVVDKTKNRGFAFVEFESHKAAAIARRRMIPGGVVLWDHEVAVDWAEPEPEVSEDIMSKVKVLYMRNLMLHTSEMVIRDTIERVAQVPPASIEKVKKLKDFAFLHFTDRHFAELALQRLSNVTIEGASVTVVWAKPPRDRVQVKGHTSTSQDSSSFSDDDIPAQALHLRPILACRPSSTPAVPTYTPFAHWETLVALSGQDQPQADITSWPHPTKPDSLMFLARITVPFVQPPCNVFMGNYASTPLGAMNSAAEGVLSWLQKNAASTSPSPFMSPPMSPVGFYCPGFPALPHT